MCIYIYIHARATVINTRMYKYIYKHTHTRVNKGIRVHVRVEHTRSSVWNRATTSRIKIARRIGNWRFRREEPATRRERSVPVSWPTSPIKYRCCAAVTSSSTDSSRDVRTSQARLVTRFRRTTHREHRNFWLTSKRNDSIGERIAGTREVGWGRGNRRWETTTWRRCCRAEAPLDRWLEP